MGSQQSTPEGQAAQDQTLNHLADQAKGAVDAARQNPQVQQAEQAAREAADKIRQNPDVKNLQEKAKEAANDLKNSSTVQNLQDKAKDALDSARNNPTVQSVEDKARQALNSVASNPQVQQLGDKAKQALEDVKANPQVQHVADNAKEGLDKVKDVLNSDQSVGEKAKQSVDVIKQTAENSSADLSQILNTARSHTWGSYIFARNQLRAINRDVPVAIANFKRDNVFQHDRTTRTVAHLGLTALTFLVTIKAGRGFVSTVKSTAFVGLASGFLINPEILNPFVRPAPEDQDE